MELLGLGRLLLLLQSNDLLLLRIAIAIALLLCSLLCYHLLSVFSFTPSSLSRKLRLQGLLVLPRPAIVGNSLQIRSSRTLASLSDLPAPSLNHSNVPDRVHPFYTSVFSQFSVRTFVYWWGVQPRVVVTKPEDVKQILSSDFKHFSKSKVQSRAFHKLFGTGLLTAEGDDWHNQRNILRPAFFSEKLKAMVADMNISAGEMTDIWDKLVKNSGNGSAEVEVASYLKNATADILARTSFGSDYTHGKGVFERQELLLRLEFKKPLVYSFIPFFRFLPVRSNVECWKIEKLIDRELSRIVEARIQLVKKGGGAARTDLLSLMLADPQDVDAKKSANYTPLTAQQIKDECKTFFFAGHETTANLLAWTMMQLALNPEWQQKVRAEVLEILDGDRAEPQADHLNKMKLLGMVLNESLRLYPPVPEISTRFFALDEEAEFKLGDLVLPRGVGLAIPVLLIHRDKELWGEDADEFRPERFREGVAKACKHPFGYLPFAVGPRICIGQSFAMLEAKVLMAAILQRFSFTLSGSYRHAPETAITMRPKHGMLLELHAL